MGRQVSVGSVSNANIDTTVASVDRVRWGAVIAGLFAAISVLIVLLVAGLAVGLSTFAPGTSAGNILIGTGVWSVISVLISFAIGGGTAARAAAVHGRGNGALNGAMVWMVAIPLLVYTLIGGVGSLISTVTGTVGSAANTAVQVAGANAVPAAQVAATTVANSPGLAATAQNAAATAAATAANAIVPTLQAVATNVANVPPQDVKNATNTASSTALSVLLWLGLGLLASTLGGYLGARSTDMIAVTTTATRT